MAARSSLNLLKSIPCFANLDSNALERLLEKTIEQSFSKGEIILLEGEPCPGLFILKTGSVKLYRTSDMGNEQIMRVVGARGCFECAPLFDHGRNPISAQTLEPSKVVFILAASFDTLINDYPEVALQFAQILSMRLRTSLNTIGDFSFKPVSSRIAKLLLQMGEREHNKRQFSLSVPLTQHNLSCIVGCTRQSVNNSLQEMARNGIIVIKNRTIVVLQPQRLHELI
jgi:CRP/FNR family transcriptional regulator